MLWSLLFGSIGFGFILYGKKQRAAIPFCVGIALCTFTYFITNIMLVLIIGAILLAIPYFVKL